jgi:hypothetical protein
LEFKTIIPTTKNNTISGLNTLAKRREFNDISLIHKLLNNNINFPELLSKIKFNVPSHFTRIQFYFQIRLPPSKL